MASRLMLCLLLACAAFPAAARQPAMMDANGGGSADCEAVGEVEDEVLRPGDKRIVVPERSRTVQPRREADGAARPPRWHSFLPGMIR